MTTGSQMPELDQGGFFAPPYKIGSQNTPYKLGLRLLKYFTAIFHDRTTEIDILIVWLLLSLLYLFSYSKAINFTRVCN